MENFRLLQHNPLAPKLVKKCSIKCKCPYHYTVHNYYYVCVQTQISHKLKISYGLDHATLQFMDNTLSFI